MGQIDSVYQSRGVPYNVANQTVPEDYLDFLTVAEKIVDDKPYTVSTSKQRQMLARTIKNPFDKYTFVIASKTDDRLPKFAAFEIFRSAFRQASNQSTPYWHNVYGSYKDSLRDDEHFRQYELGTPSLLVLNNIATNSTNVKFEKVRDLYEMYSAVPKIIVVLGEDPFTFCARHLFIPVTRLLFFE